MTLSLINDINIIGDSMTDEEVKAYVEKIEKTPVSELYNILPSYDVYNADIIMGKICDALSENVNILRKLNIESKDHELDAEIMELLKKIFICNNYLDSQTSSRNYDRELQHKLVFAKTPAGNPYFMLDLDKVPREAYAGVKKTLEGILYGVNKSDNTKVKYYAGIELPKKVLEFKGFQVRIYTTKLKGNILCVFGLSIKKADTDKKITENLKSRLSRINKQIDELKLLVNDTDKRQALLDDGKEILDNIMNILSKDNSLSSDSVELLFPSDDELEALVPFEEVTAPVQAGDDSSKENISIVETDIADNNATNDIVVVPKTSKQVKRRTRGLGKKTIARNAIMDKLKMFNLEELAKVQDFVQDLYQKKVLDDSINDIYSGFLSMSDEQIQEFENSIKYFKHDEVGRHK